MYPFYRTTRRLLAIAFLGLATQSTAQTIELTTPDGKLSIIGELLSLEDGIYTLRTGIGEIQVPVDRMTCSGENCPTEQPTAVDFTIKGSDTVGVELMPLLVRGYAESLDAVVDVQTVGERLFRLTVLGNQGLGEPLVTTLLEDLGSSTGFRGLLDQSAQIGMSSRRVRGSEVDAFAQAGLGDPLSFEQEHSIAVDGLLMVVHPDNPVDALSEQQMSDLLAGRITNWSEVGGQDQPVTVYSRDSNSGTYATIADRFLAPYNAELGPQTQILSGNVEISQAVFDDVGGFGYVGFAFQADTKALGLLSSCGIASEASEFAAKTGEYPLQRTLFLYTTNAELPDAARDLVNYAKSPQADGIVRKSGFIDFDVATRDQTNTAQNVRAALDTTESRQELAALRELYIDMLEWRRLSPTFRFRTGSAELDNASRRDLLRLTSFLAENPDVGEIALVGFTDSAGSFDANRSLGFERADSLLASMQAQLADSAFDFGTVQIKSYGELNPVACNTDFAGQQLNRRVEVWVR